jgi:hypothetical protein
MRVRAIAILIAIFSAPFLALAQWPTPKVPVISGTEVM